MCIPFRTCERFQNIVQDRSLWIRVDARQSPNTLQKALYCLHNVNEHTKQMHLAGDNKSKLLFDLAFPIGKHGTCTFSKLTVLALENQFIDGYKVWCMKNLLTVFLLTAISVFHQSVSTKSGRAKLSKFICQQLLHVFPGRWYTFSKTAGNYS